MTWREKSTKHVEQCSRGIGKSTFKRTRRVSFIFRMKISNSTKIKKVNWNKSVRMCQKVLEIGKIIIEFKWLKIWQKSRFVWPLCEQKGSRENKEKGPFGIFRRYWEYHWQLGEPFEGFSPILGQLRSDFGGQITLFLHTWATLKSFFEVEVGSTPNRVTSTPSIESSVAFCDQLECHRLLEDQPSFHRPQAPLGDHLFT